MRPWQWWTIAAALASGAECAFVMARRAEVHKTTATLWDDAITDKPKVTTDGLPGAS